MMNVSQNLIILNGTNEDYNPGMHTGSDRCCIPQFHSDFAGRACITSLYVCTYDFALVICTITEYIYKFFHGTFMFTYIFNASGIQNVEINEIN